MGLFKKRTSEKADTNPQTPPTQPAPSPIPNAGYCIVTNSILNGTSRFKWLFRQEDGIGNLWCAFGDTDSQEYVDNADNLSVVEFRQLAEIEPTVWNVFYLPVGADLEFCEDASGKYFVDTITGEEIREQVKHPGQIAFEKNLKFLNQDSYPDSFFQQLFQASSTMTPFCAGEVDFPTGQVVLADPLAYLGTKYQTPLERSIPAGHYPVTLAVLDSPFVGLRIAAAKLTISSAPIVRYELAMPQGHTIQDVDKPGVLSIFGVDTGLACFSDGASAQRFRQFLEQWNQENPDKNQYTDYFDAFFQPAPLAEPDPDYQPKLFAPWAIPGSGERLVLFSSGMGDGIFSGYWALDKEDRPVELIVPFMNPEFFEPPHKA